MKLLWLTLGGALGALMRYVFSGFVYKFMGVSFPYGTLAVNLIGCFIMGFSISLAETRFIISPNIRMFLMIGFLGAFTTFSTFMLETDNFLRDGEMMRTFMNVFLSIMLGFVCLRIGSFAGKLL